MHKQHITVHVRYYCTCTCISYSLSITSESKKLHFMDFSQRKYNDFQYTILFMHGYGSIKRHKHIHVLWQCFQQNHVVHVHVNYVHIQECISQLVLWISCYMYMYYCKVSKPSHMIANHHTWLHYSKHTCTCMKTWKELILSNQDNLLYTCIHNVHIYSMYMIYMYSIHIHV